MTDTDYRARVEAGMAWLDSFKPGWERDIDLAILDISVGCNCIIGQALRDKAQVAGAFYDGFEWALCSGVMSDADAYDRGFLDSRYAALEAEWRSAIKARFDSGVLSDMAEVRPA